MTTMSMFEILVEVSGRVVLSAVDPAADGWLLLLIQLSMSRVPAAGSALIKPHAPHVVDLLVESWS